MNADIAPSRAKLTPGERRRTQFVGKYVPVVVVLLTDGAVNAGVDPLDAARRAADRGSARVHHRLRTTRPSPLACTTVLRCVVRAKQVHELTAFLVGLSALLVIGAVAHGAVVEPVLLTAS